MTFGNQNIFVRQTDANLIANGPKQALHFTGASFDQIVAGSHCLPLRLALDSLRLQPNKSIAIFGYADDKVFHSCTSPFYSEYLETASCDIFDLLKHLLIFTSGVELLGRDL